ncbi:MAG: Rrf2 family transcriptional regulator [Candidatus Cloacimonas sp.]
MAVNTRTEYALRALLEIADSKQMAISAQSICQKQSLPKKYIERLLSNLKTANLIQSSSGAKGGYLLSRNPAEITFADIIKSVQDESLDPTCNLNSQRFCPQDKCPLSGFFATIGSRIESILSEYTLADIYNAWKGGK